MRLALLAGVLWLSALVVLAGSQGQYAGATRSLPQSGKARETAQAPLIFDALTTKLPRGYTGDPIAETFQRWLPPARGEFETSTQYAARWQAPRLAPEDLLVFLVDAEAPGFSVNYAPDSGHFTVVLVEYGARLLSGGQEEARVIRLRRQLVNSGSYLGQNAFGATKSVLSERWATFALNLANRPLRPDLSVRRLTVSDPSVKPQTLKTQIGLLVVCQGLPDITPRLTVGYRSTEPTFSRPVDSAEAYFYLDVFVVGLWLYNKETGRVYLRVAPY